MPQIYKEATPLGSGTIGVALHEASPLDTLALIRQADAAGVPAVWLTSGSGDALSIFAAAATQTSRIRMGSAVVPTWLRHPVVLAQQAALLSALAPRRFVLGLGPSHEPMMRGWYGVDFHHPLGHLRESIEVLRQAAAEGKVDLDGAHFRVHAPSVPRFTAPIMISALREGAFRLAGEVADGAIAWICPAPHLAGRARAALETGAAAAGRPVPPLVAHTFLCVTRDTDAVRADARQRLQLYPRLPFYQRMLADAGDAEGAAGRVSDALIEAVVIWGDEAECAARLAAFREASRANEVIASLLAVGPNRAASLEAGLRVVAGLAG